MRLCAHQMRQRASPGFEIMLKFGESVSAAKENKDPQIIIMRRESDDIKDTVPHLSCASCGISCLAL